MSVALEVTAATVTIQAVVIGGKNMTVAVYDQMPTDIVTPALMDYPDCTLQPLWRINRCPRGCDPADWSDWRVEKHFHILCEEDGAPIVVTCRIFAVGRDILESIAGTSRPDLLRKDVAPWSLPQIPTPEQRHEIEKIFRNMREEIIRRQQSWIDLPQAYIGVGR